MCGIFGILTPENKSLDAGILKNLAKKSETRGKDSSGLCVVRKNDLEIDVYKGALTITRLLQDQSVKRQICQLEKSKESTLCFGHSRLVTNGSQLNINNNQPILKNDLLAIHNGIIVNDKLLWERYPELNREHEIDTEVFLALVDFRLRAGDSFASAIEQTLSEIEGTVSMALFYPKLNVLALFSNNGSLYYSSQGGVIVFASERYTLESCGRHSDSIKQLNHEKTIVIDLNTGQFQEKVLDVGCVDEAAVQHRNYSVSVKNIDSKLAQREVVLDLNQIHLSAGAEREMALLKYPKEEIAALKRCAKCVLPETFPYIDFDQKGICNYCRNYVVKSQTEGIERLENLVKDYRSIDGSPDVLVPFSGGRDSSYALHVIKNELNLNPITFTYDWGMVTDLARRNIARMCGKLGVENIIVAADIAWKRENIRKNVVAWLKQPELGMIPLFMAGDKFFFYHAHRIKKQTGLDLNIWGVNDLENTNFKTGFAGLPPEFDKKRIYSISTYNKLKLFSFVGRNFIQNPSYINQSLLDSFGSIVSRYFIPKQHYYHLFDYTKWNEEEIDKILKSEYKWEVSVDTSSTWRIGDGTASFYNYIYTLTSGFSENDTFRSNQIREGMITREEALRKLELENKPRYNSIKWYLEVLSLDFHQVITRVNTMKRFY